MRRELVAFSPVVFTPKPALLVSSARNFAWSTAEIVKLTSNVMPTPNGMPFESLPPSPTFRPVTVVEKVVPGATLPSSLRRW